MKQWAYGFSVIELMTVVVIMVVLGALALPSYRAFITDSRMTAEVNEFISALNFARSEAVKRNTRVTVCKSSNSQTTTPTCATSGNWDAGWIAFVDNTGTAGTFDASDSILRVHAAITLGNTLVGTTDVASYISFVSDGRSLLANGAAQAGTLTLCPSESPAKGRQVALALGRTLVQPLNC